MRITDERVRAQGLRGEPVLRCDRTGTLIFNGFTAEPSAQCEGR
jgi:hypothetical protein